MPGFKLRSADESLTFEARFGAVPPHVTGGGPKIDRVTLPDAKEVTEWVGREPLQMVLSFEFNHFADNVPPTGELLFFGTSRPLLRIEDSDAESIENHMRALEQMQGMEKGSPEPPHLIVVGDPPGCIEHDHRHAPHLRWWLEDVEIDHERTIKGPAGRRIVVVGSLTLTEVVEYDVISTRKIKPKRKSRQRRYRVKHGDSLRSIANDEHVKGGYKKLMEINKIRDPKSIKVGQVIRLS